VPLYLFTAACSRCQKIGSAMDRARADLGNHRVYVYYAGRVNDPPRDLSVAMARAVLCALVLVCSVPMIGATGYNFAIGNTQCYPCKTGTFVGYEGAGTCDPCPPGFYQDVNGSSTCKECPEGTYNTATGSVVDSACQKCRPGTYSSLVAQDDENDCQECSAGYYSFQEGATSAAQCLPCPAGTYSSAGSQTCTPCESGHLSTQAGSISCVPSDAGYATVPNIQEWSPDCHPTDVQCINASSWRIVLGPNIQTQCEAGMYSIGGASVCTNCAPGKFSSVVGAVSESFCSVCAPGSYSALEGSTECSGCGAGFYGTEHGSSEFQSGCMRCPVGTFSTLDVASSCEGCGKGRWTNQTGLTRREDCYNCPAGTYSAMDVISSAEECVR
jgi:hypothetical protein